MTENLTTHLEAAVAKGRELAMKVAEREKAVQTHRATLEIGEREYIREKERLEKSVVELEKRKQLLKKEIKQRKKDYNSIAGNVEQLENAERSQSMNRGAAFVPGFSKN